MEEKMKKETTNNKTEASEDKETPAKDYIEVLGQIIDNLQDVLEEMIDKRYHVLIISKKEQLRFFQLPILKQSLKNVFSTDTNEKYWIAFTKPKRNCDNKLRIIEFNGNAASKMNELYYHISGHDSPELFIYHCKVIDTSYIQSHNKLMLFEEDNSFFEKNLPNFEDFDYLWNFTEHTEIASGGY